MNDIINLNSSITILIPTTKNLVARTNVIYNLNIKNLTCKADICNWLNDSFTKLLIHFDGTEGQTTYIAETGQTLTFNGDAHLDTTTKKFGNSALSCDGTVDFVSLPHSTDYEFGTNDFTIDFWINVNSFNFGYVLTKRSSYTVYGGFCIQLDSTSGLLLRATSNGSSWDIAGNGIYETQICSGMSTGVWYHIALVRSSGLWTTYLDGEFASSFNNSNAILTNTDLLRICGESDGYRADCLIDELRISKGNARWTAEFTPPTSEYSTGACQTKSNLNAQVNVLRKDNKNITCDTNVCKWTTFGYDSYTKFLTHFDGVDGDTSLTANTGQIISFFGTAHLEDTEKKFGSTSLQFRNAYPLDTDYVSVPDEDDLDFGSSDFTIDCWVRLTGYSIGYSGYYTGIVIGRDAPAERIYDLYFTGTASSWTGAGFTQPYGFNLPITYTFSLNTWYHIAVVRSGNTCYFFIDGDLKGTVDITGITFNGTIPTKIGCANDFTSYPYYLPAYIDELRISKGIARWTSSFTPPTNEYLDGACVWQKDLSAKVNVIYAEDSINLISRVNVAFNFNIKNLDSKLNVCLWHYTTYDSYTKLLLHFNGTDGQTSYTAETGQTLSFNSGSHLEVDQVKFGSTSIAFDGASDYATVPDEAGFHFGTDDFTIECWVYPIGNQGDYDFIMGQWHGTYGQNFLLAFLTNKIAFWNGSDSFNPLMQSTNVCPTDQWVHIAVTRNGSDWKLYINGAVEATYTSSSNFSYTSGALEIGGGSGYGLWFDGYIDELRISKGIARWTSAFDVPTSEYVPDGACGTKSNIDAEVEVLKSESINLISQVTIPHANDSINLVSNVNVLIENYQLLIARLIVANVGFNLDCFLTIKVPTSYQLISRVNVYYTPTIANLISQVTVLNKTYSNLISRVWIPYYNTMFIGYGYGDIPYNEGGDAPLARYFVMRVNVVYAENISNLVSRVDVYYPVGSKNLNSSITVRLNSQNNLISRLNVYYIVSQTNLISRVNVYYEVLLKNLICRLNVSGTEKYASRIEYKDGYIYMVTDESPARLLKIDINTLTWDTVTFTGYGYAKDLAINDILNVIYVPFANGKIVRIDYYNIHNYTEIDTLDASNFLMVDTYDAFDFVYLDTDENGEIIVLDFSENPYFNSNFNFLQTVRKKLNTTFNITEAKVFNSDFRFAINVKSYIKSDFRFLASVYSGVNPIPRYGSGFQVWINGVEIPDVRLDSIVIRKADETRDICSFAVARQHDNLDYTLEGTYNQITNHNPIIINVDGREVFNGTVSQIDVTSNEEVTLNCDTIANTEVAFNTISLSLSSMNTQRHLYDIVNQDISILNPQLNPAEDNPKYWGGVTVNLGTFIYEDGWRHDPLWSYIFDEDYHEQENDISMANKFDEGKIEIKPNHTYFWTLKAENLNKKPENQPLDQSLPTDRYFDGYVGTNLSPMGQDLWKMKGVEFHYQILLDNVETELGNYTVGVAPFKEISARNGKYNAFYHWEDREDGMYAVKNAEYDYVEYCKQVAQIEYLKMKNINDSVFPQTSANIDITIDAFLYYGIKLNTRINIENTIQSGIYKNNNGFPVSVKQIEINSVDMMVHLTCDNQKSEYELKQLDATYPDEESENYVVPPYLSRIRVKKSMETGEEIQVPEP